MKNIIIQIIVSLISGILAIIAGIVTANHTGKAEKRNSRQESRPYLTIKIDQNQMIVTNVSDNPCYDVKCEIELINSFFKDKKKQTYTLFSKDLLECKGKIICDYLEDSITSNKLKINKLSNKTYDYTEQMMIDFWDEKVSLLEGKENRSKIKKIVEEFKSESGISPKQIGCSLMQLSNEKIFYSVQRVKIRLLTSQFEELIYYFIPSKDGCQYKWENREKIFNKK